MKSVTDTVLQSSPMFLCLHSQNILIWPFILISPEVYVTIFCSWKVRTIPPPPQNNKLWNNKLSALFVALKNIQHLIITFMYMVRTYICRSRLWQYGRLFSFPILLLICISIISCLGYQRGQNFYLIMWYLDSFCSRYNFSYFVEYSIRPVFFIHKCLTLS